MADISRRRLLAGMGVVAGAGALCRAAASSAMPADEFGALEERYGARIGVFAANLNSSEVLTWRADDRFAMCSTFKTYAAAAVLQRAERRELRLNDTAFVAAADIKPNSPVTEKAVGRTLTLAELCAAALQQSDNAAANLLLGRLGGPPAITAFARSIGDGETRLDRYEIELNSALPGDPRDTSTPRALGGGYQRLLTGDALAAQSRQQLEDWMRANVTSSMRAGLPAGWTSADKTGSGDFGSTNDVGIAYGPDGQRVLLAMMTRSAVDDPGAPGLRPLIGEITSVVLPLILGS